MPEKNDPKQEETKQEADEERRAALKKLGKYAYAAPLVVSLLASKNASALSPPPPPNP